MLLKKNCVIIMEAMRYWGINMDTTKDEYGQELCEYLEYLEEENQEDDIA